MSFHACRTSRFITIAKTNRQLHECVIETLAGVYAHTRNTEIYRSKASIFYTIFPQFKTIFPD